METTPAPAHVTLRDHDRRGPGPHVATELRLNGVNVTAFVGPGLTIDAGTDRGTVVTLQADPRFLVVTPLPPTASGQRLATVAFAGCSLLTPRDDDALTALLASAGRPGPHVPLAFYAASVMAQ